MNRFTLIIQALRAHKTRSALLVLTTAIAFLVYGVLGAMRFSMLGGTDKYGANRLIITHESGMTQALPIAYAEKLRQIPGVQSVSPATWLGAYYQTPQNMLLAFAVDPAVWLSQHDEMQLSADAARQFLSTPNSILVSEALLQKYQWQVGTTVPLQSIMFMPTNGDNHWPFIVAGTFTSAAEAGGRNYIISHYSYLNESRSALKDTAGTFVVTAQPGVAVERLALDVDAYFAQYEHRTTTATDRAFHAEFFRQLGDITLLIKAILSIAFCSLILVVSSTLTLAIHQRVRDIGILKIVGFSRRGILLLIVGEGFLLIALGGVIGTVLAWGVNTVLSTQLPDLLPNLTLTLQVLGEVALIGALTGTLICSLPALAALRMKAVKALTSEV